MRRAFLPAGPLLAALLLAAPGHAQETPLAALKALASNPYAPAAPALAEVGYLDATYLLDGLSRSELRALVAALRSRELNAPPNIVAAVRARGGQSSGAGENGGR